MTSTIASTTSTTYAQSSTGSTDSKDVQNLLAKLNKNPFGDDPTAGMTLEDKAIVKFFSGGESINTFKGHAVAEHIARQNMLLNDKNGASMPGFFPEEAMLERKMMTAHMKGENVDAMQKELDVLRAKNRAS